MAKPGKPFRPQCLPRVRGSARLLESIYDTVVLRCTLDDGRPFTSPVRCVDANGIVWTDDAVVKPLRKENGMRRLRDDS